MTQLSKTVRIISTRLRLEGGSVSAVERQRQFVRNAMRRHTVRYGLLVFNVVLLMTVAYTVLRSSDPSAVEPPRAAASIVNAAQDTVADPLDRVSSADIAVNVARAANLPESTAITNQADSENAQLSVVQTSDSLVAKSQVVASALKSYKDIQVYTAKSGDTSASIAAQFHITADSILWSNDLASGGVVTGQKLYIPPDNGIVYVVKAGDTPDSLAQKYHASKDKIIAYNDAEIGGLKVGQRIFIPGGQIIAAPVVTARASGYGGGFPWGSGPVYGYNGYDYGYCTWYVASRIAVPSNWGNANTWDNLAPASGWTVSSVPTPGSIAQTDRGSEGHVAVVEAVSADGTMIKYSDMNGLAGWGRRGDSDWTSASRFQHYISH